MNSSYILFTPGIVFKDELYVTAETRISSDTFGGVQVLRTEDGTNWERVVKDGFGYGLRNNIAAQLYEFHGSLYLVTINQEGRSVTPQAVIELYPPRGFQLWKSDDGQNWMMVGEPGFKNANDITAGLALYGGMLYLATVNYRDGSELWQSSDGLNWERIFKEEKGSLYSHGGGPVVFNDYLYFFISDVSRGAEIWRKGPLGTTAQTPLTTGSESWITTPQTASKEIVSTPDNSLLIAMLAVIVIGALGALALRFKKGQAAAQAGAKYCTNCGNQLPGEAKFCLQCGQIQEQGKDK